MDESEMALNELVELAYEVLRALVESKPGTRWVVSGHDIGALVAQLAALQLSRKVPDSELDLVLISPLSLLPGGLETWDRGWLAKWRLKRFQRSSPLLEGRLAVEPPGQSILRRWSENWPGPLERNAWMRFMREFPGSVLVLWGARDPVNSPEIAQEILGSYQDVEYFEHERAGHWLPQEDPTWVAEKVKTFLFRTYRKPRLAG